MSIQLRFDATGVDWDEAAAIFEKAPLGTRHPKTLEQAFTRSSLVCFAWDGEILVAIGRALSDGILHSAIYDLCMLPEYQRQGLGSRMLEAILTRLNTPNCVLWSVPGKENFYARHDFRPMLTAMARFENPAKSAVQGYIKP